MLWTALGGLAATLTMFAFVPQIIKSFRLKSAKDMSIITLGQLALGVSLWIVYGFHRKDLIIIVANSTTLITIIVLILLYFKFRGKR
jgi:MtN3 and saliva related transmembrane protein